MTQEWVNLSIRAPEHVAKMARFVGNDACILILQSHLLLTRAEETRDDELCWDSLIEREYLLGLVEDLVDIRVTIQHEAAKINGMEL